MSTLDWFGVLGISLTDAGLGIIVLPKRGTNCPASHDGHHHVDTSMESGPNNCFHCERPM